MKDFMVQEQTIKQEEDENVNEDFRLLYQMSVSDIAFFKQQQWRVTNYGLLLYGVIIAIPKLLDYKLSAYECFVLSIIAFAVFVVGWYLVGSLEQALLKSRDRLIKAKDRLSKPFIDAWKGCESDDQGAKDKPSLLWLFRSVMVVGFLIVSWLLYRMACFI